MKTKLRIHTLAAVLFLVFVTATAFSQTSGPIDPATGLPMEPYQWKDPNWKDPDRVLTNVIYKDVPVTEVASRLRDECKAQFDVLLPNNDYGAHPISLELRNVTASEIFNAMNLVFENDRTPLRWELRLNGNRQVALLRVLVDPNQWVVPVNNSLRRVYFVGDLIADGTNGGMNIEQIIKTITDVWAMTDTSGGNIRFHKEAQLLVAQGTQEQLDFIEQTLGALQRKAGLERERKLFEEQKVKTAR